ncbi:MAG TPA: hypothetical protein VFY90_15155 [Tepidiformaceae bacterium]|nr:hypothetical protein [Tepidiformaceae bacterium]
MLSARCCGHGSLYGNIGGPLAVSQVWPDTMPVPLGSVFVVILPASSYAYVIAARFQSVTEVRRLASS